jgi:hypothetical protein
MNWFDEVMLKILYWFLIYNIQLIENNKNKLLKYNTLYQEVIAIVLKYLSLNNIRN